MNDEDLSVEPLEVPLKIPSYEIREPSPSPSPKLLNLITIHRGSPRHKKSFGRLATIT